LFDVERYVTHGFVVIVVVECIHFCRALRLPRLALRLLRRPHGEPTSSRLGGGWGFTPHWQRRGELRRGRDVSQGRPVCLSRRVIVLRNPRLRGKVKALRRPSRHARFMLVVIVLVFTQHLVRLHVARS
jgi:hypothetical protein